ncbi:MULTISPECIES: hypothetical protein [unclassified Rhodococcus (in: high G+C Gram-positive bacteria)]|uniref:hypothetical protein n=1 Tax=Rhodococcus sp. SJ-3 TaxID=3454628 RepID=UPI003F78BAB5
MSVSLDAQLAESFRRGVELPEDCGIDIADDRLWFLFPESDFVVQSRPAAQINVVHLFFSVAVRAPEPSLETWWDKWSRTVDRRDQVEVARREVLAGRNMILRMLEERFGDDATIANLYYA